MSKCIYLHLTFCILHLYFLNIDKTLNEVMLLYSGFHLGFKNVCRTELRASIIQGFWPLPPLLLPSHPWSKSPCLLVRIQLLLPGWPLTLPPFKKSLITVHYFIHSFFYSYSASEMTTYFLVCCIKLFFYCLTFILVSIKCIYYIPL